jgi:vacuolar-type H+-ATPase subunit F/Vma7
MALPLNSQIILKPNQVKSFVNENGDTLIAMRLDDAKVILADVLNYQIADSLVNLYELKDKENNNIILIQKNVITKLTEKSENQEKQLKILEEVIGNKDSEISLLNDVVKQQKREIRKQKILKIGGFSAAIVLPVITALILLK